MTARNRIKDLDRALHDALASVVSTQFPNPERKDCPPSNALREIARKRLPITDPAIDHVAHCSPCFNQLHEIRAAFRRRRIVWPAGAAAIIVLAIGLGYIALQPATPIDPTPVATVLDLRGLSPVRGETPETGTTPATALSLPRRVLDLTLQLPVGSAEGSYEVAVQEDDASLVSAMGEATIEDQIATLRVRIDTREVPEGEYALAVRETGLNWRLYPLNLE